jgi:signal peptidase I
MDSNNAEENPGSGVRKFFASVVDNLRTIIYAVLIALVVRTFAYEPFNIPSGSMIPTLLVGDYLFVSKYSYGYSRHSFPFSIPLFSGRVFEDMPARGDVAVFKLPSDNSTDYIKRVVGLPGDKIQVRSGVLHINGVPVRRRRIEDYARVDNGRTVFRAQQYVETLPEGRRHLLIEEMGDFGGLDDTQEFVVPKGHYFAMGDNRDNSSDSRVMTSVGFVPAENLVGRAEFLFFSIEPGVRFWEIWKWPFAIRYGRLFDGIE